MTFVDSNIRFSIIQGNTSTLTYKYAHNTTTKHSSRFQYPHSSPFIVVLGTLSIASRIIVLLFCMCLYCHPAMCCCCLLLSLLVYEAIMETNFPFVTTTRFCCATLLSSTYISAENTNQRLCHLIDIKDNHNKTPKEMINALLIRFA